MKIETHNTNPKTTKPRLWIRFRLRTLLILVTVLSVPLGWVGWEIDQRRREKVVVAWVREMGGLVRFHSSFSIDERSWWTSTTDKWLGERVSGVGLDETHTTDLAPLTKLKNLKYLTLRHTKVTDLAPLAELKDLELLDLWFTQVSGLSPLAQMKNLKQLRLGDTNLSPDLSPLAELKELKKLYLYTGLESDLLPLSGLKNLEMLFLSRSLVSEEQVEELRLALPNCKIEF